MSSDAEKGTVAPSLTPEQREALVAMAIKHGLLKKLPRSRPALTELGKRVAGLEAKP